MYMTGSLEGLGGLIMDVIRVCRWCVIRFQLQLAEHAGAHQFVEHLGADRRLVPQRLRDIQACAQVGRQQQARLQGLERIRITTTLATQAPQAGGQRGCTFSGETSCHGGSYTPVLGDKRTHHSARVSVLHDVFAEAFRRAVCSVASKRCPFQGSGA